MAKNTSRFGSGARGGARPGAGRPRGKVDRAKGALQKKVLELTEKAGKSAKDEMQWDFQFLGALARSYASQGKFADAAKYAAMASEAGARAAPYMHSRMPANVNHNHRYDFSKLTDEQLVNLEGLLSAADADAGGAPRGEAETQH